MLDNLDIFVVVVEVGSLSAAATKLGTTVATVSRRLTALEEQVGHKLIHRSARGLKLTQEGELYYSSCAQLLHSLNDRLTDLHRQQNELAGGLRVLVPANLATQPLAGFWQEFIHRYPQIQLRVDASNAFEDLHLLKADLAIRIGKLPDSNLIQKRIGSVKTVLVAKPGCWHATSLADLSALPAVSPDVLGRWQLSGSNGERQTVEVQAHFSTNDLAVAKNMVKSGRAIGLLPLSEVYADLKAQQLEQLLGNWQGPNRVVYWVWPSRHSLSIRARIFIDSLLSFLKAQPWFDDSGSDR